MSVTLNCPRCKSENPSGQRYCKRCGFGLDRTGAVSGVRRPGNDDWVGKTINGKYLITSILGEGGFGTVFRAEMLLFEDHRPFALKLLHPDLCENEQFRRRFLREAAMAMALVHPHAIQVREFDQTEEGLLYFTMDYCPGEPLHLVLAREGFFTINRAIPLALQILSVLEAAHSKEIIHRDLKPDNVFLVRDPAHGESAFVGDFGLAKSIERSSGRGESEKDLTQGGIVGTPRYMSPEQGRGEPLDGRSDLYSVGVIFFEMITGQLPPRLEGKGRIAKVSGMGSPESPGLQRLRELIPPNLVIPRSVLEVVARALEPRPAARFQSATEFREALEALPTYTPTYIEPRPRRRRRSRLVMTMALLFAVAGGALFFPSVRGSISELARAVAESTQEPSRQPPEAPASPSQPGLAVGVPTTGQPSPSASSEAVGDGGQSAAPSTAGTPVPPAAGQPGDLSGDEVSGRDLSNDGDLQRSMHPRGSDETARPVPAAFPASELRDWVPYQVGDFLTYRTSHFRGDGSEIEREETHRYRVKRLDPERGFLVEEAGEDSTGEWWWLVTPTEFSRTRTWLNERGEPEIRTLQEVRWRDDAPLAEWTRDEDHFRARWVQARRIGGQLYRDLLEVVATRKLERRGLTEEVERRTYFVQGYGEVLLETLVNGSVVLQRVLVTNPQAD
ncbi:MAG: protein kinase [Planctomycetota bacterium]